MSKRRNAVDRPPRGLYPLPAGDVPSATRCVKVNIPDGDDYEKILAGALETLTHWTAYERDVSHKGTQVAAAWRNTLLNQTVFEHCEGNLFDIRIDPEDSCMLQKTEDGGETWENVGSMNPCAETTASDILDGALGDGTITGGVSQGSPSGPPQSEQCYTYSVMLRGNDKWHCPVSVSAGWTIRIYDSGGGWGDGGVDWFCPDGSRYLLGQCREDQKYAREEDPLPTAYHGQLIGCHGTTPTWFDPLAATYTIPAGHYEEELLLQMNDDPLGDNLGSVHFQVEVCNTDTVACLCELASSVSKIAPNKWHIVVPINSWPNGEPTAVAYVYFYHGDYEIVCGRPVLTNMTGWTNANCTYTNNGGVVFWPSGSAQFPCPLEEEETWQSYFAANYEGLYDLYNLDMRSATEFEFDVEYMPC